MYTPPIDAPPCIKAGLAWNHCVEKQFNEQILNHITLTAEWTGWKFKGKDLVSPDGLRISPERLRGILWHEKRLTGGSPRASGVVYQLPIKRP
jgi:hypothetical protein